MVKRMPQIFDWNSSRSELICNTKILSYAECSQNSSQARICLPNYHENVNFLKKVYNSHAPCAFCALFCSIIGLLLCRLAGCCSLSRSPAGCGMIIADWLHASDGTKWTRKANKFAFLRPRLHCVHAADRSNFLRASGHLRLINSPLDAFARPQVETRRPHLIFIKLFSTRWKRTHNSGGMFICAFLCWRRCRFCYFFAARSTEFCGRLQSHF